MVRIKIPFGGITANQLRRVAELADRHATGVGHVTTRQDIQLHFVELKDVPSIMRGLAEVGLTTREACANTVRNVTACHLAGVCQGEVFDVTPYAKTVAYHLLRNPLNQSLPRKFKIAFSGCKHDCALTPIHDIGLLAVKRADGEIGFRMVAGGGLGSAPRIAQLLRDFTPMEELIPSIEAVIKVFDTLGNRKNRNKARMKFVIDKLGFRNSNGAGKQPTSRWDIRFPKRTFGLASAPGCPPPAHYADEKRYGKWKRKWQRDSHRLATRCRSKCGSEPTSSSRNKMGMSQRPSSCSWGTLRLNKCCSWLTWPSAIPTAIFAPRSIRTWSSDGFLPIRSRIFYEDLASRGLADPGAELVEDIIACPGTDTCGLGITSSKGLARALAEVFPAGLVPEDLQDVSVKISGCHNSCAQHHISTIGLHGVGKRLGDHVAPHYELHLGGSVNGTAKIGQMTVKLPAKAVPAAISHLIDVYRRDRQANENLPKFIARVGKNKLKDELIPYTIVPSYQEDPTFYYDWEGEEEFILEDLGPGECAGGALEMIENGILEADQELYQAKLLIEKHQYSVSVNKSYRAVLAAAKAMLVTEGLEPSTDSETFIEFDSRIAQNGVVPSVYRDLSKKVGDLGPKETATESAQEKMAFAKGFVDACRAATDQMGKDLKLSAGKRREVPGLCRRRPRPSRLLLLRRVRLFMTCVAWRAQ